MQKLQLHLELRPASELSCFLHWACKLWTNTSLHTHLQELQTTFPNCTETHHCEVSTCTLAPLLLLHLELLQELQPASLAAAKPPNDTALQLHSKLQISCMKTSAANTASANCIAWPQPVHQGSSFSLYEPAAEVLHLLPREASSCCKPSMAAAISSLQNALLAGNDTVCTCTVCTRFSMAF